MGHFFCEIFLIVEYMLNYNNEKDKGDFMKVRCDITGLDCAHCATKLEKMLKNKFLDANLNYALGTLVLDVLENADEDEVVAKAQAVSNDFEDGIEISLRD